VNDTTNAALLTGHLLSLGRNKKENKNTCAMHTQELVVTHALGIRQRRAVNEVVNDFPEGCNLRERVKALLSFVMDRKSKARFKEYTSLCNDNTGTKGIVLELPNDTRVAGTYRMFLSCLRSRIPLQIFCTSSSQSEKMIALKLNHNEWQLLAEFECVLKECHELAMQTQLDMVGANSYSYFAAQDTRYRLATQKMFEYVDLKCNYLPSSIRSDLPKTKDERAHLHVETQTLLTRLVTEFKFYFGKPDSDQLLQMFFHPYMVWSGYT
jgi:hypothetical protein